MMQEYMLREAGRVGYYINNHVKLAGAEKRDEVLALFESMHRVFPQWVIATCPMMHPDILYMSPNCDHVFGHDREYLIRKSKIENYLFHVHEDDQKDLFECIKFMQRFLEDVGFEDHHRYRAILYYRFRHANGSYIHLHDEKTALYLGPSGNLYYALFRDLTEEKPFGGVKMEIYQQDETLAKIKEYRPSVKRNPMTPREQDIVTLIRKGLSMKEIAWQLGISQNTVRNIKSRLFEKYNVSNSIELLNFTE